MGFSLGGIGDKDTPSHAREKPRVEEKAIKMAPQPPKGRGSGCGHPGRRKPGGPHRSSGVLEGASIPVRMSWGSRMSAPCRLICTLWPARRSRWLSGIRGPRCAGLRIGGEGGAAAASPLIPALRVGAAGSGN